jgi:hypothetical protein
MKAYTRLEQPNDGGQISQKEFKVFVAIMKEDLEKTSIFGSQNLGFTHKYDQINHLKIHYK